MSLGTLLADLFSGLLRRPTTVAYPRERVTPPPQLRGALQWRPAQCTGCGLCVKDCPAGAIELITLDKAAKRFVLRYDLDRCVFCGQCLLSCRFKCIELSGAHWELAAINRDPFHQLLGDAANVNAVLGSRAESGARPAG